MRSLYLLFPLGRLNRLNLRDGWRFRCTTMFTGLSFARMMGWEEVTSYSGHQECDSRPRSFGMGWDGMRSFVVLGCLFTSSFLYFCEDDGTKGTWKLTSTLVIKKVNAPALLDVMGWVAFRFPILLLLLRGMRSPSTLTSLCHNYQSCMDGGQWSWSRLLIEKSISSRAMVQVHISKRQNPNLPNISWLMTTAHFTSLHFTSPPLIWSGVSLHVEISTLWWSHIPNLDIYPKLWWIKKYNASSFSSLAWGLIMSAVRIPAPLLHDV